MNTKKLLTISIPTWNRSSLIKGLLDELVAQIVSYQLTDEVEIVVSNNGSVDTTHETITEFVNQFPFITYNRNEVNLGANPNVMLSMQLAASEFLIFLGDDDRITDGSLKRIVEFLKIHKDAGVIVDSFNFKKKSEGLVTLPELLRNYYWIMGNAGLFMVRSSYVKESLDKYGAAFFNQCWSQTQFMVLGLNEHKEDKIYIQDLNIVSHSVHGEVTIYNSFYLWMGAYFDLFRAIKDLENIVSNETYLAGRMYLKNNIAQLFFNFLQCGIFIDDAETRNKTRVHIAKHRKLFSTYEQVYMVAAIVLLGMPNSIAKFLSNIFIFLLKGKAGMQKKNDFVNTEKGKIAKAKIAKSIAVRKLELED